MRRNPLAIVLALAALVLATTAPAMAQSTEDEYIAEATGDGYSVEILGEVTDESIFGGFSEVEVTSDPSAFASGVGTSLAEDSESSAAVSADGESEADVDNCAVPDMPADELQFIGDLLNSCSSAEAAIADGLPTAAAEADGLVLDLSGDILVEVLVDTLLMAFAEQVDPGFNELEEAVLQPVVDGIRQECDNGQQQLCDLLEAFVDVAPGVDEEEGLLEALGNVIANALEGRSLLLVELAGSESASAATAGAAAADAGAVGLYVELLPLAVLGAVVSEVDAFVDILGDMIQEFEEQFEEEAPEELVDFVQQVQPGVLLDDESPLLAITGGQTSVSATFDRGTGEATASGEALGLRVDIAENIAALLGQDPTIIEVEEGEEAVILDGTPLESRLAASFVTVDDDAERDGLPGASAVAEALALSLIQFEDDSWVLDVAAGASHAAAYGVVDEVVDAPPPLPITGGGIALLALALLGAGLLLRRRD